MPEYLSPGVYIEETSFRSKTIEGVSTSTAGFVGPARYGPVSGAPVLVTSLAEFQRIFGDLEDLNFNDPIDILRHGHPRRANDAVRTDSCRDLPSLGSQVGRCRFPIRDDGDDLCDLVHIMHGPDGGLLQRFRQPEEVVDMLSHANPFVVDARSRRRHAAVLCQRQRLHKSIGQKAAARR